MDETWITQVYRPFFGERSPLGGRPWANIMDRALQWSLDLRGRSDAELVRHIVGELAQDEVALQVGFIDDETLRRWRQLVRELLEQPPSWDRFGRIASRYLKDAGIETAEALEDFLRLLPDVAEEAVRYLSWERVQAFLDDSVARGLEAVRRYLCA
jgi:transposase-like protein